MRKVLIVAVAACMMTSMAYAQPGGQERQDRAAAQDQKTDDKAATLTPVAAEDGVVTLSPENTKVDFVGTHEGDQPNPRFGGFEKFSGKIEMADDGMVKSMAVEFKMDSVWTTIPNLTNHLKNDDFLDVTKYPTAKFVSTKIAKDDAKDGTYNVTGKFTLLDETSEISFPAIIAVNDDGVTIKSEFKLDRTEFGMTKMTERVSKAVAIKVMVGQKTTGPESGGAGRGMRGRRQGGGQFDPEALFKRMDANGDGKIAGDEISDRMQRLVESGDADKNGELTKEEFTKAMEALRGGGRGGNRGGGREGRGGGRPGGDGGN